MPRFSPAPDVVARRLGDETVIVHLQTNRIYSLNRTGSRLWELLTAGHDRPEIERLLQMEFDVGADQLTGEVEDILSSLRAGQLILEVA